MISSNVKGYRGNHGLICPAWGREVFREARNGEVSQAAKCREIRSSRRYNISCSKQATIPATSPAPQKTHTRTNLARKTQGNTLQTIRYKRGPRLVSTLGDRRPSYANDGTADLGLSERAANCGSLQSEDFREDASNGKRPPRQ